MPYGDGRAVRVAGAETHMSQHRASGTSERDLARLMHHVRPSPMDRGPPPALVASDGTEQRTTSVCAPRPSSPAFCVAIGPV